VGAFEREEERARSLDRWMERFEYMIFELNDSGAWQVMGALSLHM
jgi:hypothetical protein